MGPITRREKTMGILAIHCPDLLDRRHQWIVPEMTALVVCALMMLTGVVTWNDIAGNKQGWTNLVWLATLVTMADGLARVGFLSWFAKTSATVLSRVSMVPMMIALVAIFFLCIISLPASVPTPPPCCRCFWRR